jgi:hypothetical protein
VQQDQTVSEMAQEVLMRHAEALAHRSGRSLERVLNSIRNGLGMGKTEIAKEPSRPRNPHFYAVFAQVHNTL